MNLAIGDFLMGAYLLVIAAVDVYFRGVYATEETSWRKSLLCRSAGFCSTLSSELSVFTLTGEENCFCVWKRVFSLRLFQANHLRKKTICNHTKEIFDRRGNRLVQSLLNGG